MTGILNQQVQRYPKQLADIEDWLLDEIYAYAREHDMPALERQASHLPTVLISALRPMPETKLITCSVSTQAVDVAEGLFNRIGIMEWIDSRLTGYLDGLSEFLESGVGCRGDVNVPGTDS